MHEAATCLWNHESTWAGKLCLWYRLKRGFASIKEVLDTSMDWLRNVFSVRVVEKLIHALLERAAEIRGSVACHLTLFVLIGTIYVYLGLWLEEAIALSKHYCEWMRYMRMLETLSHYRIAYTWMMTLYTGAHSTLRFVGSTVFWEKNRNRLAAILGIHDLRRALRRHLPVLCKHTDSEVEYFSAFWIVRSEYRNRHLHHRTLRWFNSDFYEFCTYMNIAAQTSFSIDKNHMWCCELLCKYCSKHVRTSSIKK